MKFRSSITQSHTDSLYYPMPLTLVTGLLRPIRCSFKYLTINNTLNTRVAGYAHLPNKKRLYTEYSYKHEKYRKRNDSTGDIEDFPITSSALCRKYGGTWETSNNRCIRKTITRVDIEDIVNFYENNPDLGGAEHAKQVFEEYLNTEIFAIPPIPLRIENKDFDNSRYFSQEYTDTVINIMNFF